MYPKATLQCPKCGSTTRRQLLREAGCREHHETQSETATCPKCRIQMEKS